MTDTPETELSMLEAIELFNIRPTTEWTPAELVAFRSRLQQSPSLVSVLGGREQIEKRLAQVSEFHAQALREPEPLDGQAPPAMADSPPARRPYRRYVEVACIALGLCLAGAWVVSLISTPNETVDGSHDQRPGSNGSTKDHQSISQADRPDATPESAPPDGAAETRSIETPEGVEKWQGWTVVPQPGVKTTLKKEWDLTDPANAKPADVLAARGGALKLTKRIAATTSDHFLELNAQSLTPPQHAGRIVISVNDKQLMETTIGGGTSSWPVYVPLEAIPGREAQFEIAFTPVEADQSIVWWSAELVSERRFQARPESEIVAALTSGSAKARRWSARNAAKTRDPIALEALVRALNDSNREVRLASAEALGRYDTPLAREALRAALDKHADADLRAQIATILMPKVEEADIAPLTKGLVDADAKVRAACAKALARSRDPRAIAPLTRALADADANVQVAAATALGGRERLKDTPEVRAAVEAAMVKALSQSTSDEVRKKAAIFFRMTPSPQAIEPLIALAKTGSDQVRTLAVRALAVVNDPRATAALVQVLNDPRPMVRKHAITALAQRDPKMVSATLLAILANNRDESAQNLAAEYFRDHPDPQAIEPLTQAMKQGSDQVRFNMIQALAAINDPRASAALAPALDDALPQVRLVAATSLVHRKGKEADAACLSALASNKDDNVRRLAAQHFQVSPSPAAVGPLIGLLTSEKETLRRQAVFSLGRIGDDAALEGLRTALSDKTPKVRQMAIRALRQIDRDQARAILKQSGLDK